MKDFVTGFLLLVLALFGLVTVLMQATLVEMDRSTWVLVLGWTCLVVGWTGFLFVASTSRSSTRNAP
jgi:hypothetical protein